MLPSVQSDVLLPDPPPWPVTVWQRGLVQSSGDCDCFIQGRELGSYVANFPRLLLHVEQSEVSAAIVLFKVILVAENLVILCSFCRNCSLTSAFSFFTAPISFFILSIPFSISKHLEPNLSILSLIFFKQFFNLVFQKPSILCPSQRFKLSFVFLNVS